MAKHGEGSEREPDQSREPKPRSERQRASQAEAGGAGSGDPGACYMSHIGTRPMETAPLVAGHTFPDAAAVDAAAARIGHRDEPAHIGERSVLSVSPGTVAVGTRRGEGSGTPTGGATRGSISGWSRQSRARMVRTLAELDYGPMMGAGLPCMVTLTLPGDWRTVCADGSAFKSMVKAFRMRWRRRWGSDLVGVWKVEYQMRGAPHLHVYTTPPLDAGFPAWLSRAWAEVVAHPDAAEFAKHLAAGTGIDYAEGIRSRDPRRLAVYFSKHGTFSAKDYQNQPPEGWGSPGRVWGVWGLKKAVTTVTLRDDRERVEVARLLRRMGRYRGVKRVQRGERVDWSTGEVTPRFRSVHRRMERMNGSAGFTVVNSGPAVAADLARYLEALRGDSPIP